MNLSISPGNSKLGKRVYNISLPPEKACGKSVPCSTTCYARKAWLMYPNVREAWLKNWTAFLRDPDGYFEEISDTCRLKTVNQFRWHVAGDIPDGAQHTYQYLLGMHRVAEANPETQFLCFTKNKFILNPTILAGVPSNLKYIFSMWPGYLDAGLTKAYAEGHAPLPLAWYKPKECADQVYNEVMDDILLNSTECNGKCDDCFKCWYMEPSMSVIMEEH